MLRTRGADGELTGQVRAGTGRRAVPPQSLRWIRCATAGPLRGGPNVLAPERLSAAEAIALYTARWRVERMYFDLKEVLINRIYAANPNAVAMQVYAAALDCAWRKPRPPRRSA